MPHGSEFSSWCKKLKKQKLAWNVLVGSADQEIVGGEGAVRVELCGVVMCSYVLLK